jgi:cell fate regulator YaaT (PSP1 superfamily)
MSAAGGSSVTDPAPSCESTKAVTCPDSKSTTGGSDAVTFRVGLEEQKEEEAGVSAVNEPYFEVEFRPGRKVICQSVMERPPSTDDLVVIDADRGIDIGRVVGVVPMPSSEQTRGARIIRRLAVSKEIASLRGKARAETRARQIGQEEADTLRLLMRITYAHFQFDGTRVTFYYSSPPFIDFRRLVPTLSITLGARISMERE